MSSDLTASNNQLLKNIGKQILNDSNLQKMCESEASKQQEALKAVFAQMTDNNVSSNEKITLEKGAESLLEKIDKLKKDMAALKEKIDEKSAEVQDKADEITDLIMDAQSESEVMEQEHKEIVNQAVTDVFDEYKRENIGQDQITSQIAKRIKGSSQLSRHQGKIEKILGKITSQKAKVQNLGNEAAGLIDQKNSLENQYTIRKSSHDLINRTLSQIGNTQTSYTNFDTDKNIPVYSIAKTDIITDIFNQYMPDKTAGQEAASKYTGEAKTQKNIESDFAKYLNTSKGDVKDIYTYDNPAVKSLESAMKDENFTNALKNSNMSVSDLGKFFAKNFANAGVGFDDKTGTIKIPYGHGQEAKGPYNALSEFMKSYTEPNESRYYSSNALDIDTNPDLQKLSENNNYSQIIDKLANGNPKFTFKEAMYALFDENKGLFKNSGIKYNAATQSNPPSYTIGNAQDKETYDFYKNVASKIKEAWGVDAKFANESLPENRYDQNVNPGENEDKIEEKRTDPITFKQGNTEYAFVIDRNKDGKFGNSKKPDDYTEFVGAKEGTSWLEDLKSLDKDGNGKLSGDELKDLKLLASEYQDNAKTTKDGKYLRSDTNNINYKMTDAQSMGIEEIDLTDLENNVNKSQGKTDINGSELFNDSISFKMNGKDITATRKDDTKSFMNTVYKNAQGKNFNIGFSEKQVDATWQKYRNEADEVFGDTTEFEQNASMLQNIENLEQESRNMYESTKERIENDQQAELIKANNKARAQTTLHSWSSIENQVRSIASVEGIDIDMEQAKGIYNSHTGMGARSVVNEYKKQMSTRESNNNARKNSQVAWEAMIKSYKMGINATADEINKIVSEGRANTVDGILEILKQEKQ